MAGYVQWTSSCILKFSQWLFRTWDPCFEKIT